MRQPGRLAHIFCGTAAPGCAQLSLLIRISSQQFEERAVLQEVRFVRDQSRRPPENEGEQQKEADYLEEFTHSSHRAGASRFRPM